VRELAKRCERLILEPGLILHSSNSSETLYVRQSLREGDPTLAILEPIGKSIGRATGAMLVGAISGVGRLSLLWEIAQKK
jgi:hypothetical protein